MITNAEMEEMFKATFAEILELRRLKSGEYAQDQDALNNFRSDAADLGLNMETIWRVFANKHWRSLSKYISDLETGFKRERSEPIEGRVDDLIVYLLLFKAIMKERSVEESLMGVNVRRRTETAI